MNAQESLGEGEAGELRTLLEGVKPAMPGETATAAIEDLNGLVSDLQLGQQTAAVSAAQVCAPVGLPKNSAARFCWKSSTAIRRPWSRGKASKNRMPGPPLVGQQRECRNEPLQRRAPGLRPEPDEQRDGPTSSEHVTGVNPYASIKTIVEKAGTVADKLNTVIGLFGSKDVSATEAESEEAGDRQGVKQEAGNSLVTWKTLDEQNESAGLKAFKADGEDISGDTEEEAFTTLAAESEGSIKETVADTSLAADEVTEEVASIGMDAGEDAAEVGLACWIPLSHCRHFRTPPR